MPLILSGTGVMIARGLEAIHLDENRHRPALTTPSSSTQESGRQPVEMSQSKAPHDGKAYKIPGQHIYEGLILGQYSPPHHLAKLKVMDILDDDVIVSTYPKSGTTLVLEIVWLVLHDADVAAANKVSTWERIPFIEYYNSAEDDGLKNAAVTPQPRLLKSHLQRHLLPVGVKQKNIKQITVLRNPKDLLVSYYYFYKSTVTFGKFTGTWNEFFEMFMADNLCWGNLFDHALEWWKSKDEPNVLVLFFEDLLRNPLGEIARMAKFLEKRLSAENIEAIAAATNFQTMKSNPMTNATNISDEIDFSISPFMRKGTVGDWQNHFTPEQVKKMDEVTKAKLEGTGINYTYEL